MFVWDGCYLVFSKIILVFIAMKEVDGHFGMMVATNNRSSFHSLLNAIGNKINPILDYYFVQTGRCISHLILN